jgi:hypothetical protein
MATGRRGAEEPTWLTRAKNPVLPRPSMMAVTTAPTAPRRLRPGSCSCPDGRSAAAASLGGSQAWRDGSHRSSRMSAARPCWASTSRATSSAVAAASAVAVYKKTPAFPAVTEISSPARPRSRSQTESARTGFPEASWTQAIRLTRHSSSTLQAYAKRMLQAPHHHALSACRPTELHDLCVVLARSGASWNRSESAVRRGRTGCHLGNPGPPSSGFGCLVPEACCLEDPYRTGQSVGSCATCH